MKSSWRKMAVVLAFSATVVFAPAQISKLGQVPPGLPEARFAELKKTRETLLQRRNAMQARVREHNAKCGNVTVGTALEKECEAEQKQLEVERDRYNKLVAEYNASLSRAAAQVPYSNPIAGLSEVQGKVWIETLDGRILTAADLTVENLVFGSRVVTGAGGKITVRLLNDHSITLAPNSEFTPDGVASDPKTGEKSLLLSLVRGLGSVMDSNPVSKDEKGRLRYGMKVRTPSAVCGVRGTKFDVSVAEDGSSYIKLFSGQLEITSKKDGSVFMLEANQMVNFDAKGASTPPQPIR